MKYTVITTVTVDLVTCVEAETREQAVEMANERGITSPCHACGGNPSVEWALADGIGDVPEPAELTGVLDGHSG